MNSGLPQDQDRIRRRLIGELIAMPSSLQGKVDGCAALALMVVKMCTGSQSRDLREDVIGARGMEVGGSFAKHSGVLSGIPVPSTPVTLLSLRLGDEERLVLQSLLDRGESTAEEIASRIGLARKPVQGLLKSLSRRLYVAEVVEPGRVTYHVVLPACFPPAANKVRRTLILTLSLFRKREGTGWPARRRGVEVPSPAAAGEG